MPVVGSEAFAVATPFSSFFLLLRLSGLPVDLILQACVPHHERNVLALATARDQDTFLFFPPSFLSLSMLQLVVGCTIRAARAAALLPSPPEESKEEET